jgi:hypothetical protein
MPLLNRRPSHQNAQRRSRVGASGPHVMCTSELPIVAPSLQMATECLTLFVNGRVVRISSAAVGSRVPPILSTRLQKTARQCEMPSAYPVDRDTRPVVL